MTHQSPKTHRDPPEPRLLDDGFLDDEPRASFTGWELDAYPRMVVVPADPTPHRLAWFGLGVCVGVLLLALLILGRVAIEGAGS